MAVTYSKSYPGRARVNVEPDELAADDSQPSMQTLSLQLVRLQEEMRKRRGDDTGVHRMRVHELAEQVNHALNHRDEEKRAAARGRIIKSVWGILASSVVAGGGYTTYAATAERPKVVTTATVQETVQDEGAKVVRRVERNSDATKEISVRVDKLENIAVEQQIQMVDGVDYLSDKIDAISSKARRIEKPETLHRAKRHADRQRTRSDLFGED